MKKRLLILAFLGVCTFAGVATTQVPHWLGQSAQAQSADAGGYQASNAAWALGKVFEQVTSKVAPSVVSVEAFYDAPAKNTSAGKNKIVEESGSGLIVSMGGYQGYCVLTNSHVIAQAPLSQITLRLADGQLLQPVKVWRDPETDVAVLGLHQQVKSLPTAKLGDSNQVRVGQWVLAIGSPFGLNQTVTHGIISARERGEVSLGNTIRIKDFLQTDAAINPGSSGGPLVDMNAEVIGINTAIASHSGSSSGVAFAIPINLVKKVSEQLLLHGMVPRGYLGMQLARNFEPKDALGLGLSKLQGALVDKVYANTPAAAAGLQTNDVVLRIESVDIKNENHLINLISKLPAGQRVQLSVWRSRQLITLSAVVGDWNKAQGQFQQP
jgi:S1-C subfamily serine protease